MDFSAVPEEDFVLKADEAVLMSPSMNHAEPRPGSVFPAARYGTRVPSGNPGNEMEKTGSS